MFVSHPFQRVGWVTIFNQSSSVQQQEISRTQDLPLDDVYEFMKMHGFIGSCVRHQEIRVSVCDSAHRLHFKTGKIREALPRVVALADDR
jgi:hypothetical protein